MWVLIAFLNPSLHALSNVLDNYLVNRLFERKTTLIFYATLLNALFLPFLFLFAGLPSFPADNALLIFIGLAFINVIYLYPYYKALEQNDTSKVVALFSLSQLFVPVLAYVVVREVLTPLQYVGAGLIMATSLALSLERNSLSKLNGSFWWMVLCTFILAFEYVLYKLAFVSVDWITGFSWPVIFSFGFALPLLLVTAIRNDIVSSWALFRRKFHVFATEELTTFLGIAAGTYAISVAPVTLVKAIVSTEPAFVLLYAVAFRKLYPRVFKEQVDRISIYKKLALFVIMGVGVVLAVGTSLDG